jgi:nicotinamide phosphoribosyltransferase
MIGGMAHLINFSGTDNLIALRAIREIYGDEEMMGFSVPAAEHSTITSWFPQNEHLAYRNMLEQFPEGYVSVVSDSYDLYNALENIWGGTLWPLVNSRKGKGTLVIRPDSGNPVETVLKTLNILAKHFPPSEIKGYKVLPDQVRIIQGDGVNKNSIKEILQEMSLDGWSADNIVFGMGGGLLQQVNRDTYKVAMKASNITINGKDYPFNKSPITDPGKASKKGKLALIDLHGNYVTAPLQGNEDNDLLVTHFKNGDILTKSTFKEIRQRAAV